MAYLRNEQDKDLQAFNLHFDEYYLESSLYTSGRVEATVNKLVANGKTYEQDGALWLRARTTATTRTASCASRTAPTPTSCPTWPTTLPSGARLHQGRQHPGHRPPRHHRPRARGLQAADVGIPRGYPDYVLHTMVRVVGGEEVKISKRAGSYVTLRDLIEWTSKDAVRFFLLSRKPDTEYTFDVDLAVAQNNDNPVYYVQYAHARIQSVLRAWKEAGGGDVASLQDVDLSDPAEGPQAQALMLQLAGTPDAHGCCRGRRRHDVTFYLRDLAASYHSYYDAERILVDDEGR